MYVKLYFKNYGELPIYVSDGEYVKLLKGCLPLKSTAELWKEEYYFETPIEYNGKETLKVKPGNVAYWAPGKAFCVFYGFSQPYSPVAIVGEVLGPLYYLRELPEEKIEVELDELYEDDSIVSFLRNKGFKSAKRNWMGDESIVVNVNVKPLTDILPERVGFDVYVEDYGYIIESDSLLSYENSLLSLKTRKAFKNAVEKLSISGEVREKIRVDINEDYYICLSAFANNLEEVHRLLEAMARLYIQILDFLEVLS
ncbi:MAG: hypothetical protein J7K82_03805 [Thermoproteales archaeon]|nr:hypothetical protein [Thermoproteales archaeon]